MSEQPDADERIRPRLLRTLYGEWLAVSPPDAALCIGVMGRTAEGAIANFRQSWAEWEATARLPWWPGIHQGAPDPAASPTNANLNESPGTEPQ
jgi:hypothetical protein